MNLIQSLQYINDNAWCHRTFWKAEKTFKEIKTQLTQEESEKLYRTLLECDPDYPDYNGSMHDKTFLSSYIKRLQLKYQKEED